ncbi:transcriptional regulator [Haladaptatus pallidirubidus]|nr:transcriptional regulator [Haladaptatus pallidirubidus]
MSDQSRTDSGHYAETITLERVFRVFDQIEGPTITSRDVADVLDCSTEAARQKLGQLHEQGRIHRRKSGRTVLWWRADDAQAATEFDPDDPLFAEPPSFASEEPTDAANVDEYLYGPIEANSDDE